ncbi:MAG: response regulator transcription factor [Flavobacteriales bacterium]|nr:response regulator transcription factor [Flavobacteriales bacterium]
MEQSGSAVLRIAVVDDHPLFRQGVIRVLEGWGKPHMVLEAANGVDYEERCKEWGHVHLALVDLRMPERDGYETLSWIRRHQPRTVALAISFDTGPVVVMRAMRCRAYGVLCKTALPTELFSAMDSALRKHVFVNELVTAQLWHSCQAEADQCEACWAALTPREKEFVRCYTRTDVDTLVDVARRMGISRHTAETYRRNVYRKLGLHSDKELMHFVLTNQLD